MIDKIGNAAAANAYANTAKSMLGEAPVKGPSFSEFMGNGLMGGINMMKAGETMSAKAVTGDATLPDVVQAVNAADMSLKTIVAVRDKLVGAYTEMMRMQI